MGKILFFYSKIVFFFQKIINTLLVFALFIYYFCLLLFLSSPSSCPPLVLPTTSYRPLSTVNRTNIKYQTITKEMISSSSIYYQYFNKFRELIICTMDRSCSLNLTRRSTRNDWKVHIRNWWMEYDRMINVKTTYLILKRDVYQIIETIYENLSDCNA